MNKGLTFARRTQWNFDCNPITQALHSIRQKGGVVLDLTRSNPTQCRFPYPQDMIEPLSAPENLQYEPSPQGSLAAREAVAGYYRKRGLYVNTDNIFLTASTSEAYAFLFRLLANPGDRIFFPQPSYPLFQFLTELNDVVLEHYLLKYRGSWSVDENIKALNFGSAKALVVVNPNNPTGSYIKEREYGILKDVCLQNDLALIADEVFWDYSFSKDENRVNFTDKKDTLTFTLGGLSKTLALPQMKLSWIVVSGPEALVESSKKRLELIADTYLSVNSPVQNILKHWLDRAEIIQKPVKDRIQENLNFLKSVSESFKVEGGWYGIIRIDEKYQEEGFVLNLLAEDGVYVHPGYFYDMNKSNCIVVSLLPPSEEFKEGISRVLKRVSV